MTTPLGYSAAPRFEHFKFFDYIRRMDEASSHRADENASDEIDGTPSERPNGEVKGVRRLDPLLIIAALAVAITLVVLGSVAAAAYAFHWEGFWRGMGQPYATTLAALAAVIAGAIALHNSRSQLAELRAQRREDQFRWEEQRNRESIKDLRGRFAHIITQLASANATVRRSGAYAMAALANDWRSLGEEQEVKVCLGVLAAYLTSPNPTYTDAPSPNAGEDGPVRALIVALLSSNAGDGLEDLWGSSTLLAGADLRGVSFSAPVDRVDFSRADLSGASFENAKLRGVRFWEADLSHVDFSWAGLEGAELGFAKLPGANLMGAHLERSSLVYADLQGASLYATKLEGADVDGADLHGADLSTAELSGLNLVGIAYDNETKWPDGFTPPPST